MINPIKQEEALKNYKGEDRIILASELKEELKTTFEKIKFYKSGFPTFDFLTKGFYTGEVICITGKAKRGKTCFGRSLTWNFLKQGVKSLWFPFDVPSFMFFYSFGEKLPIFYLPRQLKEEAMNWLNARIQEAKVKYDIKAVFIDDLGYLIDLVHSRNSSIELGTICRQLVQLAKNNNVMIFVMHHAKRMGTDKDPTEDDLRDSALIAGIVSKVITVMRKQEADQYSNEGKIIINIDRVSGTMKKAFSVIYKDNKYYEKSDDPFDEGIETGNPTGTIELLA